jgi:hypothetical protein
MRVSLNHAELTVPVGALTRERKRQIAAFYEDVLGFKEASVETVPAKYRKHLVSKQAALMEFLAQEHVLGLRLSGEWPYEMLILHESDDAMDLASARLIPHLGVMLDSRQAVTNVLEKVLSHLETEPGIELSASPAKLVEDMTTEPDFAAFQFRYVSPLWWDVFWQDREAIPWIDFHDVA